MREAWSPEQIRGRIQREHGQTISHEWMYQYIYKDKQAGGDLYRALRCQKARRKRYGTYSRRGRIPNQVSIDERPAVVNARQRIGDWEGDTVIGKGQRGGLSDLGGTPLQVYGAARGATEDRHCGPHGGHSWTLATQGLRADDYL